MVDSPRAPGAPAETPAAEAGTAPSRVPRWLLPALLAFVAAAAGIGGGFVVAPRITAFRQAAASDTTAESASGAEGGGGAEGEGGADRYYRIENLVINPAGSVGSLLLVSVVFDIARVEERVRLESRDAEVRDRIATVLSAQTLDMLRAPSVRDSLKRLIAAAVAPLLGPRTPVQVFLPQFVIQ